ncbi:Uncharacterised protein [Mycoplasmopsis citelli]|uniref:Uncharacterized protein n=1 Tax=Mycoplasmopsis citelli TaxID=171281 RepID=A0A449B2H7_9BACT|nr:hypothetical protein [Mycoplasmopsis citelli]VEU74783.1 Uncharacterised protein [Mycoplasmopsis citelli]
MKSSIKKHLLLSLGGFSLIGTILGFGIGFGTAKTINQNQISFLNNQLNALNLKFQKYNLANKEDKLKVQTLQSQSNNLQFLVQNLQESDLSSENLDASLSEVNLQKISESEIRYKELEKPLQNWKANLVKKVSTLNKTLKNLLEKNNNLNQEIRQGVTDSLNKGKTLFNSLKDITFHDKDSTIKAFKNIQKAQNIFLNQLNSSINLIIGQISKHKQEVDDLNNQIAKRDEKIKELAEKLISQLIFYLKLIAQFKNSLQDFNDFDFAETDAVQSEKIKTQIQETIKFIAKKEILFSELLDQMNESLDEAKENNDYSDVESYNLNIVQKNFEKIVKEYDLVRSAIIPLYKKWNQEKGTQIVNQAKQITNLETQNQNLQVQIDSLNAQKTTLEEDLMNNLNSVLENQITVLSGIEDTIRNSDDSNAESLVNNLKDQIDKLKDLKSKYNIENYNQTFTPIINQALRTAQEVINEYKITVFNPLKSQYQNILDELNTTKEQLQSTQSQLSSKQRELEDTQSALSLIQIQLSESQNNLAITRSHLQTLNNEIFSNKEKAIDTFNFVKEIHDNLKVKANTLTTKVESNVDLQALRTQLDKQILNIEETDTLEQIQEKIKSLINLSTNLNSAYGDTLQKDYEAKSIGLTGLITSLRNSKNELQATINFLEGKQATNINKVLQEYNEIKSKATTIRDKAKQYQINTSELDSVLQLTELNIPRNNLEQQINFISEYTTRIINLSKQSINLQNQLFKKSDKLSKTISDRNKQLQHNLDLANFEIQGKVRIIGHLTDRVKDLEKQLKSKINQLENQNQILSSTQEELRQKSREIQNQNNLINQNKDKLSEALANYTKYRNVILNSNVYQNATRGFMFDPYFTNLSTTDQQIKTGYTSKSDKDKYGEYFTLLNPGITPQQVSVTNKLNLLTKKSQKDVYKFRIYYIDDKETNDSEKLKFKDIQIDRKKLENNTTFYTELYSEETKWKYPGKKLYTTEFVITKLIAGSSNKIEFTNVIASSSVLDKNIQRSTYSNSDIYPHITISKLISSSRPIISVQEIE